MTKKRKIKPIPRSSSELLAGDRVRVRRGIRDTDYPDMPLGGWTGTVTEVRVDGMATVRWSRETLAAIHPVYVKRCERDGTRAEMYWIEEKTLEPDQGGPLDIEQPTEIDTRPLSPDDQDDRIRMIFELASDEPLPQVEEKTLRTYYAHLLEHLVFPFEADCTWETGPFSSKTIRVKVTGLGDPGDDELMIDDLHGIFCKGRHGRRHVTLPLGELDVKKRKVVRHLIDDYGYWFWNFG